jgi:hypothetical protein
MAEIGVFKDYLKPFKMVAPIAETFNMRPHGNK